MNSRIRKRSERSSAEDQAALLGALKAQPDMEFRASDLSRVSGVPKKFVRRALTVNGDGVTGVEGVTVIRKKGAFWFLSR